MAKIDVLCFVFILTLSTSECKSLGGKSTNVPHVPTVEALNFMKRFGYLEQSSSNSEALYREDAIKDAIKLVQMYGAIPQTGVIDNATMELMATRRCGVPDIIRHKRNKRFIIGHKGWRKSVITYFIANWSPQLGRDVVQKIIQKALDAWGKYGRLVFKQVNDPGADIIVAFARGPHGDRFPFDGPGYILAHAFYPYEQADIGGDIHFDDDENWIDGSNSNEKEGTDFFSVAVHELGHSLGLGHSPIQSSIMFPYYYGNGQKGFALDYDDILGIYELYIRNRADMDETTYINSEETPEDTTKVQIEYTTKSFIPTSVPTTKERVSESTTISYIGDFETVDDHKGHEKIPHYRPRIWNVPDICEGDFDAVATLREELFFFKEKYVWRLKKRLEIEDGYPVKISQLFRDLPQDIRIDAAYERPDGMIILFSGDKYWVHDGTQVRENSPKPLTQYGLPSSLFQVDAAQVWKKNGKTYLYSNNFFWRYNETTKTVDKGYPKHMERWKGVPLNIDAATTWIDGYTYFFKGKLCWKFDNNWVAVSDSSPLPAAQTWLGCPERDTITQYYDKRQ